MNIRQTLNTAGFDIADIEPLGGGCVSDVYLIQTADRKKFVAKADDSATASLPVEAFMLAYLAENTRLPVPEVFFSSEELLVMAYVPGDSHFDVQAECHAAELLAELHSQTAPAYGFSRATVIGGLPQPNPISGSWLEFFRDHRLLYMANEGYQTGRLPGSILQRIEKLCFYLSDWLDEPVKPSLIHGDVWTTNLLAHDGRITAFLDPAIYFADPEIELAFTTLFHTFGRGFFERYHEIRPIAPGFFEGRCDLYNLYPLLVHVRLFGGSYVASVDRVLKQFGF